MPDDLSASENSDIDDDCSNWKNLYFIETEA